MPTKDLRTFLAQIDELGELNRLDGVDWNLEMGGIVDVMFREAGDALNRPRAVLYDKVPGYAPGYRTLFGQIGSMKRLATALEMSTDYDTTMSFVQSLRDKLRDVRPITPKLVSDSPLLENVHTGDDVDILEFPVPLHHELDGGRFFGTADCVITRDPDTGFVNLGTYRAQVFDSKKVGSNITASKHGRLHRNRYFDRGEPCPMVIVLGAHPILWTVASVEIPWGVPEIDYAGGLRGEPIDVVKGPVTGLPIPACAEIAVEGYCYPDDAVIEGPFGEWMGYYRGGTKKNPIMHIKSILHRNNPIMSCAHPSRPPYDYSLHKALFKSALLWDDLEKAGVPGVRGAWRHEAGGTRLFTIVSIEPRYSGHAKQVGVLTAGLHSGSLIGNYIVVVDDDIDPSNTYDVLWAMATRSTPDKDCIILDGAVPDRFAPTTDPDNSKIIIDACRPFNKKNEFPPVAETSPELRQKLVEKFGKEIFK